jgi:uncharacterized LabA/DUF88 family protein
MRDSNDLRLAVLIDADNIPYSRIKEVLTEVTKYGNPTFKRIYGDWTKPTLSGWKTVLLQNAITPIQQYSYTTGKNATDSAMIIDAMDILYTGRVDGFCIVSSDSDFTRLAIRFREAGVKVIGFGEKKTPISFISACDKFIYIEILDPIDDENPSPQKVKKTYNNPHYKPLPETFLSMGADLIELLTDSISDLADDDGWTFLGDLGNLLIKKHPDFDPRNYGFKKLVPLIKSIDSFEVDERRVGKNNITHVYVKNKP